MSERRDSICSGCGGAVLDGQHIDIRRHTMFVRNDYIDSQLGEPDVPPTQADYDRLGEEFDDWLVERDAFAIQRRIEQDQHISDLQERIRELGKANVKKNRLIISVRSFVEDWPDDPFGRKRDQILRLLEGFKGR